MNELTNVYKNIDENLRTWIHVNTRISHNVPANSLPLSRHV